MMCCYNEKTVDVKRGKRGKNHRFPNIVRPTKKPTSFGPIRGVPKYGVGGGTQKECSVQKVEKVGVGNLYGAPF